MIDETYLTIQKAEMMEILCSLNAMITANTARAIQNQSLAYDEHDFNVLAIRCKQIQEALLTQYVEGSGNDST